MGALPLAEPFAALDANDVRMVGTLDVMEEVGTCCRRRAGTGSEARKKKGLSTDDAWFWNFYAGFPKCSHNANIYLLQDDVPSFLRFWMNSYAALVGANGKMWEWHRLAAAEYGDCTSSDNGTAGWFMENFRNLLVMEDGRSLWVAPPRLGSGWSRVRRLPSKALRPTSGLWPMKSSRTSTTARSPPPSNTEPPSAQGAIVRLRHPKAQPIKSVTVNGQPWSGFNKDKEVVELTGWTGKVVAVATY